MKVVGIDPDAERNGVAVYDTDTGKLTTGAMPFAELVDYMRLLKDCAEFKRFDIVVAVEAGWLNTSNWHVSPRDTPHSAAAKGNAVGRNHETGRKLVEMARFYGIDVREVKPLPLRYGALRLWSGRDGKCTADDLKALTGYTGRTNQEARDAALIAWTTAGNRLEIDSTHKQHNDGTETAMAQS